MLRDLGLVAVDDDYFAQTSVPPLTTVRQPTLEAGPHDGPTS